MTFIDHMPDLTFKRFQTQILDRSHLLVLFVLHSLVCIFYDLHPILVYRADLKQLSKIPKSKTTSGLKNR